MIMAVVIFFFLARNLIQSWQEIPFEKIKFNFVFVLLSLMPIFVNFLYGAYLWQKILSNLGEKISFKYSLAITGVSLLGKYLPGKVWYAVGRIYFAKKLGVDEKKGFIGVVLENGFLLLSSLVIFALSPLTHNLSSLQSYLYLSIALAIIFTIALHPFFARRILNAFSKLTKKSNFELDYGFLPMLFLTFCYGIAWVIFGIGFYLLIISFYPLQFSSIWDLISAFAISWNIGFITLIAPAGLGIRESILTLLLSLFLPRPIAIIISLLSRIWITIAEVIFALISLKFLPRQISEATQK